MDNGFKDRIKLIFGVKKKEDFRFVNDYLRRALENDKDLIAELTEQDINAINAYFEA